MDRAEAIANAQARLTREEAIANAQSRLEAPQEEVGIAANVGRAAAKGATEALGFPGEVAMAIPKAGAFMAGDQDMLEHLSKVNPTGAFADIFNFIGVNTDPDLSNAGFQERLLTNTAEAITGGAVGIGLGGQARGIVSKGAQKLGQGRLGHIAAEDALAATAGAGVRSIAQEAGMSDPAAGIGEFSASFLTGGILAKMQMAKEGYQSFKNAKGNFKQSEFNKASRFVQDPVLAGGNDPRQLASELRASGPSGEELLTGGAKTQNTELISLENALIKSDPVLQDKFMQSKKDLNAFMNDELRTALGGDGVPEDFIQNYRQSADWALHVTEKARQNAIEQASKEIAELPPIGVDYSTPIKTRLAAAKDADRRIEKELWGDRVNAPVEPSSGVPDKPYLTEALAELQGEIANAGRAGDTLSMPDRATMAAVTAMTEGDPPTVNEVLALRSSLLDSAAQATENQDHNLARRLNILADGALNSLDSVSGPNAEAIRQARQFSKDLNDRYSRDVIAPLLATTGRRDAKTPGNETMERLFKSGEKGRTNLRALNLAMGGTPEEAKSYILQQFHSKVIDDGISVRKAEDFIKTYRPALEETGLLDTVSAYVKTGRAVDMAQKELADLISPSNMDATAKYMKSYGETGDDLVNFIGATLKAEARSSQTVLREMYQNSLTDLSGQALSGLKSATVDGALRAMTTAAGDPSAKLPQISARIVNALTATGQFSTEQIERVKQIGTILHKQAKAESQRAFRGQSNTPQDLAAINVLAAAARFVGLTQIAPLVKGSGPGSLGAASMIGSKMESLMRHVTKDDAASLIKQAIFDPPLMAALMDNPVTISDKNAGIIRKALNATRKAFVTGGVRPSQTTIFNESEEDDGR